MRRIAGRSCLVVLFALSTACAPAAPPPPAAPAGPTPAELKAAADQLDQDFIAAFNKGDAAAVMTNYWNSPDLVTAAPDTMAVGYSNAQAGAEAMFKGMPGAQLELVTKNNRVEGSVVIGWGTWRLTIPAKPKPQVIEGRYTDVKAMKDGKMVYLMDHGSVPLPPPPAEAAKRQ
jgi:ketosteroid isomerase-like protein